MILKLLKVSLVALSFAIGVLLAAPARAQTPVVPVYPLMDIHRLSIAAGGDYSWYAKNTLTPDNHEFKYGAFAAYVLGRNLSAVGGVKYGASRHEMEEYVGVRVLVFNGASYK